MDYYKNKFKLTGAIGNNIFSYEDRRVKEIIVTVLKEQENTLSIEEGEVAFIEKDEKEELCKGLKYFSRFECNGKPIYIFDNHNHCFFFTIYEILKNDYKNLNIIHIDQHKDMRSPDISFVDFCKYTKDEVREIIEQNSIDFNKSYKDSDDILSKAYEYTNFCLNVGNYIVPLVDANYIDKVNIIDSKVGLENLNVDEGDYMLNIDLDFFSRDMDYISEELKLNKINQAIKKAKFVTIATSPFFIEIRRCQDIIKKLIFD